MIILSKEMVAPIVNYAIDNGIDKGYELLKYSFVVRVCIFLNF